MIAAVVAARSHDDFVAAVRALDRTLLSGFYIVPLFYAPDQWIAYSSALGRPEEDADVRRQHRALWCAAPVTGLRLRRPSMHIAPTAIAPKEAPMSKGEALTIDVVERRGPSLVLISANDASSRLSLRPATASIAVHWRPYQLDPTIPEGGLDRRAI